MDSHARKGWHHSNPESPETCIQDRISAFLSVVPDNVGCPGGPVAACQSFVEEFPPEHRVRLLLALYDRYRARVGLLKSGGIEKSPISGLITYALQVLIGVLFEQGIQPTETESCQILSGAYHGCGHGSDVDPPYLLALAHFKNRLYTRALFDAAAKYRSAFDGLKSTQAQLMRRRLDVLLWQDLRHPPSNAACWTSRIHQSLVLMNPTERKVWQRLFQTFVVNDQPRPNKDWGRQAPRTLARFPKGCFSRRMHAWLGESTLSKKVPLSTAGSHVLKNLLWYVKLHADGDLNAIALDLFDLEWADTSKAEKIDTALRFLKSSRLI